MFTFFDEILGAPDLSGRALAGASLRYADLRGANLAFTSLAGADLHWAHLSVAYLDDADLRGADLRGADLSGANLAFTRLDEADLTDTVLDPMRPPNGQCIEFERTPDGWCIGYRTKESPYMGGAGYVVGEIYHAPVFSTCDTECHPGLFVRPTVKAAKQWGRNIVQVLFRPWECHQAGAKWRVRWFLVWDEI